MPRLWPWPDCTLEKKTKKRRCTLGELVGNQRDFFLLGGSGSNLEPPGHRLLGRLARYRGRLVVTTGLSATSFCWSWDEGDVLHGQEVGGWVGGQQAAGSRLVPLGGGSGAGEAESLLCPFTYHPG